MGLGEVGTVGDDGRRDQNLARKIITDCKTGLEHEIQTQIQVR